MGVERLMRVVDQWCAMRMVIGGCIVCTTVVCGCTTMGSECWAQEFLVILFYGLPP